MAQQYLDGADGYREEYRIEHKQALEAGDNIDGFTDDILDIITQVTEKPLAPDDLLLNAITDSITLHKVLQSIDEKCPNSVTLMDLYQNFTVGELAKFLYERQLKTL